MQEDATVDATGVGSGISRRDMLRRSAVVGGAGAMMWAAPSITKFGGAAFGQTEGTPAGKDFSYIALRYDCGDGPMSIKWEFELDEQGNPVIADCETGNFQTPFEPGGTCNFETAGSQPADCGPDSRFTITFPNGNLSKITVCVVEECTLEGIGVGKCGSNTEQSGGECKELMVSGNCATFDACGA